MSGIAINWSRIEGMLAKMKAAGQFPSENEQKINQKKCQEGLKPRKPSGLVKPL